MRLGDFSVCVPEGVEKESGYVEMVHGTKYKLQLSNTSRRPCDAEVHIDGKHVGTWRINAGVVALLERPVHDTGRFTFYRLKTQEASKAGLVRSEKLGLISVVFKPELAPDSGLRFSAEADFEAGGTGLSGRSEQTFRKVPALNYDPFGFITIHLRLVSSEDEPRPLTPSSTPIPPPVH